MKPTISAAVGAVPPVTLGAVPPQQPAVAIMAPAATAVPADIRWRGRALQPR